MSQLIVIVRRPGAPHYQGLLITHTTAARIFLRSTCKAEKAFHSEVAGHYDASGNQLEVAARPI